MLVHCMTDCWFVGAGYRLIYGIELASPADHPGQKPTCQNTVKDPYTDHENWWGPGTRRDSEG